MGRVSTGGVRGAALAYGAGGGGACGRGGSSPRHDLLGILSSRVPAALCLGFCSPAWGAWSLSGQFNVLVIFIFCDRWIEKVNGLFYGFVLNRLLHISFGSL